MRVRLGATHYEVRRVKNVLLAVQSKHPDERDPMEGYIRDGKIYIEKGTPEEEAERFFHECCHTAVHGVDEEKEEAIVRHLEDNLVPLLWRQGWRPFGGG